MQTNAPVRNQHNARHMESPGEHNDQPSMTVPDQALSIREILRRFSHGIPLDGQQIPIFDENEDDLPDFRHMDLADRQEYEIQLKEELQAIQDKHNRYQAALKAAKIPSTPQGGTTEGGPAPDGGSVTGS